MDALQARAVAVVTDSFRRLREGGFAQPTLAVEEIRRLGNLCDEPHSRVVNAWLDAHDARQRANATRLRARQARASADRRRMRRKLRLLEPDPPPSDT